MPRELVVVVICCILLVVSGGVIGCAAGSHLCGADWQKAAVEVGVAEWRVDPKTGETEFVWIKCQEVGL
jgi:hypothetical protein